MKAIRVAALLLPMFYLLGCSTYSTREQRTAAGIAIAVVIAGAAVHGARRDDNQNLAESAGQPAK